MKVGEIFDSSQGSRKQKPQPDRILTEAKLALAVPIGDTNIQAECSAGVKRKAPAALETTGAESGLSAVVAAYSVRFAQRESMKCVSQS